MCQTKCKIHKTCLRFTATPNKLYQSWMIVTKDNLDKNTNTDTINIRRPIVKTPYCEYFINNKKLKKQ